MNNVFFPGREMTMAEYLAIRHTLSSTDLIRISDSSDYPLAVGESLIAGGSPAGLDGTFLTSTDETSSYPNSVDIGAVGTNGTKNILEYLITDGVASFNDINIPASTNGFLVNTSGTSAFGTALTLSNPQEFSVTNGTLSLIQTSNSFDVSESGNDNQLAIIGGENISRVGNFRARINTTGINLENTVVPDLGFFMLDNSIRIYGSSNAFIDIYPTFISNTVGTGIYQSISTTSNKNNFSSTVFTELTPTSNELRVSDCKVLMDGTSTVISSISSPNVYVDVDSTGVNINADTNTYMNLTPTTHDSRVGDARIQQSVTETIISSVSVPTVNMTMSSAGTRISGSATVYTDISPTQITNNVGTNIYESLNSTSMKNFFSSTAVTELTPTTFEAIMGTARVYLAGNQTLINNVGSTDLFISVNSTGVRISGSTNTFLSVTPTGYALQGTTSLNITQETGVGTVFNLNSLNFTWNNLNSGTGTSLVIDGSGVVTSLTSSIRYKKDINELEVDSSKIYELNSKSFTYKDSGQRTFGLIAEEVNEIIPELVVLDNEGLPHGISYNSMPILLLEEMKKLKLRLDNLEKLI